MAIIITDPMAIPTYANGPYQRFCESLLKDPRDSVMVRLTLRVLAVQVPLLALLVWRFNWALLAVFVGLSLFQVPPVILMLHNTMHRPFLKWGWATKAHAALFSVLMGIPMGYAEHHIGMHHAENNVGDDLSATYHYERDNFFHWLKYVARFFFLSYVEVPLYFMKRKKPVMALRALVGELAHAAVIAAICLFDARLGLVGFLLPYVIVRLMMMVGNWGQHAFVHPEKPQNSLVNSITCINSGYNHRCFNDGYHIGHHVKPNRAWYELPGDFVANIDRYAKEGCIVFRDIDFFLVSVLLFVRRYDVLAKKFVSLDGVERSEAEIIDFLKARTRPVPISVSLHEGVAASA
jgi:fatty acid desaturase